MLWDVLRDEEGNPITLTPEQVRAVWHAIGVWRDVCETEGSPQADGWAGRKLINTADLAKSRLLGRMLIDGRPPLFEIPGRYLGAVAYHEVEPELDHYYLGQVFYARPGPDGKLHAVDPRTESTDDATAVTKRWPK